MKNWNRKFAGGAVALIVATSSASALELVHASAVAEAPGQAAVGSLMEPINPFVSGRVGSTTSITQIGEFNQASAAVQGHSSASLISQSGSGNRAAQIVEGHNSAALLVQGGTNNSVVQASHGDNNFQLVGVSGSNNEIGYVQIGNNLAGVLDVRDSVNTTVVAIQTPSTNNYMMPSGLRGLENKAVVIVPGRMYVLPKKPGF